MLSGVVTIFSHLSLHHTLPMTTSAIIKKGRFFKVFFQHPLWNIGLQKYVVDLMIPSCLFFLHWCWKEIPWNSFAKVSILSWVGIWSTKVLGAPSIVKYFLLKLYRISSHISSLAKVLCNRFGWRLKFIKLPWHMFDLQIIWSFDSKWGTSILSNFWNLNFPLKIYLNDDLWPSTSGGIFLTNYALDSGEQTNILSIRWTLAALVLWTPPEVPLTPLLPWLFFFAKYSTMH